MSLLGKSRNEINHAQNDFRNEVQDKHGKRSRDFDADKLAENARNRDNANQRHAEESLRRGRR